MTIAVVGGGPSGLAAAFRLQQAGKTVRVLEASGRAGSKLATAARDGFLIDTGAFFIPTTHKYFLGIARDAGFLDELVPGGFVFGAARDGRIHHLDGDHLARDFARTGLLSTRSKLSAWKLGVEVLRARRTTTERMPESAAYDGQTVAAWSREHLHGELAEYVIGATMRGIFAIDPDDSPRVDFLAVLALFKGAKLAAFRRGMGFYADQLARQLDVQLGCEVTAVEDQGDGVAVTWREADGAERSERVEGCVVAVPASQAVAILPRLDAWRAGYMGRVRDGKLVVLNVGLSRPPAGVRATYTIVPRSEHPFLGGVVCDHHKAPGRVPSGKGLLTLAAVNAWCEQHYDDDDERLVEALIGALECVMPGTADAVEFAEVARWRQQYSPVGHYRDLGRFRAACDAQDRRVQLAGDYHSSQNLSAATYAGERAARNLISAIG